MKLLLVNDQGESVACFERVEHYDAQKSGSVLALLDFLETLIATARGKQDNRKSEIPRVAEPRSGVGGNAQAAMGSGSIQAGRDATAAA